ncbi:hypothetical protein GCM10028798_12960 [Humibacter antri]
MPEQVLVAQNMRGSRGPTRAYCDMPPITCLTAGGVAVEPSRSVTDRTHDEFAPYLEFVARTDASLSAVAQEGIRLAGPAFARRAVQAS